MSVAEISLTNISKTFNPGLFKKKVQAVRDLSLEVAPGEVYGLIGPNGAGKSTTIRVLLGLIRPDTGDIRFRGEPLRHGDFHKEIGYLPENPYLYDYLTLEELLQFCGRVSGVAGEERRKRIDALAEKLQLTEALRRPLRTYSKGMLQRAGVCFALLHDPAIVILDEPMSSLDEEGRAGVMAMIEGLKQAGVAVLVVEHDLLPLAHLDRWLLLDAGRLRADAAPAELLADPRLLVGLGLLMDEDKPPARGANTASDGAI